MCSMILGSCTKKIDATNEMTMKTSVQNIAKSMGEVEQEEFLEAVETVGFHYLFEGEDEQRKALHKKTAKQIIKLAKQIEAEESEEIIKSQSKLDASNFETLRNSMADLELTLSRDEIREFNWAAEQIYEMYGAKESEKNFLKRFENKTPREIINDAEKILAKDTKKAAKKKPWE